MRLPVLSNSMSEIERRVDAESVLGICGTLGGSSVGRILPKFQERHNLINLVTVFYL